jgi:desulfoferrodoxin (superoxide reductase-like protein)
MMPIEERHALVHVKISIGLKLGNRLVPITHIGWVEMIIGEGKIGTSQET